LTGKVELYRIFCQVAKYNSFSQAAKTLYLSQPAVSQSVKQLEEQLGVQLFTRGSKGVTLTAQGKMLYEYASSAMGLLDSAEQKLQSMKELTVGELRIGAGDVIIKNLLLPYLERFHQIYPQVHLSILNRTSRESMELLQSGIIDVAFVNLPMEGEAMRVHHTFPVHDVFVAGEKFSELKDRVLTLGEIARCPLIMLERASNSRRQVDRYFMTKGIDLSPQIELGAHDLLCDYARIGLGIACVTREFTDHDENSGLFEIKLDTPVPERSIGVCYTENTELSAAAKRYIELVMSSDIDD